MLTVILILVQKNPAADMNLCPVFVHSHENVDFCNSSAAILLHFSGEKRGNRATTNSVLRWKIQRFQIPILSRILNIFLPSQYFLLSLSQLSSLSLLFCCITFSYFDGVSSEGARPTLYPISGNRLVA